MQKHLLSTSSNDAYPAEVQANPEDDGLFLLDLNSGKSRLILSIADVIRASRHEEAQGRPAWFNHVLFNTNGTRALFFCRVKREKGWYSSLWTVNPDGTDLECQIPFGYWISHFAWRDAQRILISSDFLGKRGFLEFTDGQRHFKPFGEGVLPSDGHASFSFDGRWIVTDSYPQKPKRLSELMLYNIEDNGKVSLGKFHSDDKFTGDIRCDLHPRWSHDGNLISFDSVHEGHRQIYLVDVSETT